MITVAAQDGVPLAVEQHPAAGAPRGVIVLAPATGAPARFYRGIGRELAARGLETLAFDYRGVGQSRHGSLRGLEADMATWGTRDLAAVLGFAAARADALGLPLGAVLHSISGFLFGLCPTAARVARVVTVGAQTAYPFDVRPGALPGALAVSHALMPALTLALGYFPARRLGLGEDLPRGVALDWARRILHPDIGRVVTAAHDHFAEVRAPILALAADDDHFATPRAMARLHARYVAAQVTTRRVVPAELGVAAIGHLGLLGKAHAAQVAPLLAAALIDPL